MKKTSLILSMLVISLITTAYCAEKVVLTEGSLSAGKFYKYSTQPLSQFADELATNWSSGSKLTDELRFVYPSIENIVGFKGVKSFDIIADLGKIYTLKSVRISCVNSGSLTLSYPEKIEVFTSAADDVWNPAGMRTISDKGENKSQWFDFECSAKARYVKYTVYPPQNKIIAIDEIDIQGVIENKWRLAPETGCYHGAFPPAYGFSKEMRQGRSGMMLDTFEELVGKKLSMVLWYQGMAEGRDFAEIQKWRADNLGKEYNGHRLMMYGWLPKISVKRIADGELDAYFEKYFKDSVDPKQLNGINDPMFIRPMNEFNSTWVEWGLDPYNFRRAWRRMYNIAEQFGATDKHIFVWSVNHRSYPNEDWNNMNNYYPGDNYVDWVGISCYPPSLPVVKIEDLRYPRERLKEFYNLYAHKKPLAIAEGGFSESSDRARWVTEWFTSIKKDYPAIKAFIWENHNDRVIQSDDEALEIYRRLIRDHYWLDKTGTNTIGFEHKNYGLEIR